MFSASPTAPHIARRSRHFAFGPNTDSPDGLNASHPNLSDELALLLDVLANRLSKVPSARAPLGQDTSWVVPFLSCLIPLERLLNFISKTIEVLP
jgi:hypothetical protein